MKINNILLSGLLVFSGLLTISCENELCRDDQPALEFGHPDAPYVEGYVTVGRDVSGTSVVLSYKNGCRRTVELDVENTTGIYADKFSVTLEENGGIVRIPLKGSCEVTGIQELKARIHYDRFYIFCPFEIGVRPEIVDDIEIIGTPELTGIFLRGIETEAYVSVDYVNGWGRTISARFECADNGLSRESVPFRLNLDGTAGSLSIPVSGKPETSGEGVEAVMILELEDVDEPGRWVFTFDINEPVPYVQEEVRQYLIVNDRNDLLADASCLEVKEFVYNTVFVDMNGDGYVTGNYEIWLDRNVGATSTDVTSEDSYGFIYQGARNAPGYIANSQGGGFWNGEMKSVNNMFWYNGTSAEVTEAAIPDLKVAPYTVGPKNPCPAGYRMPTAAEFARLAAYLGSSVDAYTGAPLYFPLPGEYNGNTASAISNRGKLGAYWTAPVNNGQISTLIINESADAKENKPAGTEVKKSPSVAAVNRTKGSGCSIRCVKAKDEEIAEYSYSANPTEPVDLSL